MQRIIIVTGILLLASGAWAQDQEPSPPLSIVALQVALDRQGFGVGLIDNKNGARTQAALADFKQAKGIAQEQDLRAKLALDQVGTAPADWIEASQVPRMACQSLPEYLSEKFHMAEDYLRSLNPAIADWNSTNIPGKSIMVPNVLPGNSPARAAWIAVDCRQFRLRALDGAGQIIASFPCSIAMAGKTIPSGDLKVTVLAPNPNYTFDPINYPESPRAREIGRRLMIPAGPNNPVGLFWIGLNSPGFGIHGTAHPETIGSRESHGCFRLTNWDILRLSRMITAGTPVKVTGLDVD